MNYIKTIAKNYSQLENAVQSVSKTRGCVTLTAELNDAKDCLARIANLPSPVKEAVFVQNALAGLFSLDRAA